MEYEPKQAVYLPTCDFLELELHLMDTRPGVKPEAFLTELVQRWLAVEMERLALRKNGTALRGFQWKKGRSQEPSATPTCCKVLPCRETIFI